MAWRCLTGCNAQDLRVFQLFPVIPVPDDPYMLGTAEAVKDLGSVPEHVPLLPSHYCGTSQISSEA